MTEQWKIVPIENGAVSKTQYGIFDRDEEGRVSWADDRIYRSAVDAQAAKELLPKHMQNTAFIDGVALVRDISASPPSNKVIVDREDLETVLVKHNSYPTWISAAKRLREALSND